MGFVFVDFGALDPNLAKKTQDTLRTPMPKQTGNLKTSSFSKTYGFPKVTHFRIFVSLSDNLSGSLYIRFLIFFHKPTWCRSELAERPRLHSNHWPKPDPEIPEIAVIGRSNVGKLLGRKRVQVLWRLKSLDLQDAVPDDFWILVGGCWIKMIQDSESISRDCMIGIF